MMDDLKCTSLSGRTLESLARVINCFLEINQGKIEVVTNNVVYAGYGGYHAVIIYKELSH